jgi:hypothetical protein
MIVYGETIRKKSRKQTTLGMASVLIAGVGLSVFFITSEFQTIFFAMETLLILFGIYSIVFYPIVFPKRLKRSAQKEYKKNMLSEKGFVVKFTDRGVEEIIIDQENAKKVFKWADFRIIYIYDQYIVFVRREQKGIVVPSRVLKIKHDAELKSYVIYKANENEVKVVYQK